MVTQITAHYNKSMQKSLYDGLQQQRKLRLQLPQAQQKQKIKKNVTWSDDY